MGFILLIQIIKNISTQSEAKRLQKTINLILK